MNRIALMLLGCAGYLALVGAFSPGDVGVGLLAGIVFARLLRPAQPMRRAPDLRQLPRFIVGAALQLGAGAYTMLKVLLGIQRWTCAGTVRVPVEPRSDAGAVLSSIVVTASPGTIVVDTDETEREFEVNAIDAADPEALRRDLSRFYERYQRPYLP